MELVSRIIFVAIGGACGAVLRYLINISPLADVLRPFPLPTFVINIVGSFLIGFLLIALTDKFQVSEDFRMMTLVGLVGAFTTFSTFEMELYGLVRDRSVWIAAVYLAASVALGFIAVAAGISLGRRL